MSYVPNYSTRRVYWAAQETGTIWVPTATNTAGWFGLGTKGEILCGLPVREHTLIWTTLDLWTMTYIGGDFLFSFAQAGDNCGIISTRAAVSLDTGAYWMGQDRFFLFDGFVNPIPCEVGDYVFGRLNRAQIAKIWALANPKFSEVTWFYPSGGNTECDSYVTYNFEEKHWSFGALGRTCGVTVQPGIAAVGPVMVDSTGHIFDHETGSAKPGAGTVYLESGPLEIGEGDQTARVQLIIPDDKTVGDVRAYLYTSFAPDDVEVSRGPFTLSKITNLRASARQVRLRLEEVVATAWRVGVVRLGAIMGGRR